MGTMAEKRLEALEFWNRYGLDATQDTVFVRRPILFCT